MVNIFIVIINYKGNKDQEKNINKFVNRYKDI